VISLHIINCLAGLIIVAEAMNKLHRTAPCAAGLSCHGRIVAILKACAWLLLGFGGGAVLFAPVFALLQPNGIAPTSLSETSTMVGFAILIIRTRVKEG